jgi:hypothetical protein
VAREYKFVREFTNPGAITLLQIAAGTAMPFVVIRAWVTQRSSVTSTQIGAEVVRKTAAATVTAAVAADFKKVDPGDAAASVQLGAALSGHTATVEGTDGDAMDIQGVNILNGYYYTPVPEERETVPGGGLVALKLLTAPPAGTYQAGLVIREGVDA